MEAHDKSFHFMSTPSYYDIPFFQRAYVWNEDNWEELLQNLTDETQNHFLGSIILKNELVPSGETPRFFVIDGQQRLTTLSILLRACFDHILKNNNKYQYSQESLLKNKGLMENLLFVTEGGFSSKRHIKINHSHLDKNAYESVVRGEFADENEWQNHSNKKENDKENSIIQGYAYFRDALRSRDQKTIERLWDLLTMDKVRFLVNIDLGASDNEQAIFDTVNTAGVRLSSADTIKNLLYQRYIEVLRQEGMNDADINAVQKYDETWAKAFLKDEETDSYWLTERQYGRMLRSNIETFLHSFAVIKEFFNPAVDNMVDLPQRYREIVTNMDKQKLEEFLNDIYSYAEVFKEYFFHNKQSLGFTNTIDRLLTVCAALEISTFYPYILQQLYVLNAKEKTSEVISGRLLDLERYLVLNAICKGSTKNYNNECVQLVDKKKTPSEICQESGYITEEAFVSGLRKMTVNKYPTLLLFMIELYKRDQEKVDIKELVYDYTLEHIMPRKWHQNWTTVPVYDLDGNLVEDEEEKERIRNDAIYQIGNMTILNSKLNSSISNSAFMDKIDGKKGKKGIKDLADLMITKEVISNSTDWNETEIYTRTEELERLIREIWDAESLPKENAVQRNGNKSGTSGTGNTNTEKNGRYEIRKRYWTYALPIIQKKHMTQRDTFSNCTPTKSNTKTGYFGISGFGISCVANYDCARIDFFMGKNDVDENKAAFDMLHNYKSEIEEELGIPLTWERADEYKSSWISYHLYGVSIINENDWPQMAQFHAEWSDKICNVMIRYLVDMYPELKDGIRMEKIAALARAWAKTKPYVQLDEERCNRTYTRFKTVIMSEILPDSKELSEWNTPNHYFYEVYNPNGKKIYIKLALNSQGLSESEMGICRKLAEQCSTDLTEDWKWKTLFKTNNIDVDENIDESKLFEGLDTCLEEIKEIESNMKRQF